MVDILQDIPEIIAKDGTVEEPYECGAGTYLIKVSNWEETECDAYLEAVLHAGFRIKIQDITGTGNVKVSIFEKDERYFTVAYYPGMKISRITVSKNKFEVEWDGESIFADIPSVTALGLPNKEPEDYGAGNYVVVAEDVTFEDYQAYLKLLSDAGYKELVRNGEGLANAVFTVIYKKDNKVVTVTLVKKIQKLYISACYDLPLSKHLFYDEKDVQSNSKEAKTKLHMPELWWFGNSFIIQLKNGHFIMSDGGFPTETEYLLDYLESLTAPGEKPVIEAWFISHGHSDHCSILRKFATEPELAARIYVEGIYFNQPSEKVLGLEPPARDDFVFNIRAAEALRTPTGETTKLYRPQTGQRYYFNDITVDIVMAQEQLAFCDYSGDLNDSSTWCMFNIEGQKMLLGGDGDKGGVKFIEESYEREYMTMELFSLLHHGWNVWDHFTDFCTVRSVLNTCDSKYPLRRIQAINHMKASVEEWIERVNGTKILTFPYEVGTAECLPQRDWIYHKGQKRP